MKRARKLYYSARNQLCSLFVAGHVFIMRPWFRARFYIGWEEYHRNGNYKGRLFAMGQEYAASAFIRYREWEYYSWCMLKRQPEVLWRYRLLPWSFEKPSLMETLRRSGAFKSVLT
ncbi:MAG: hypothetical protein A3H69_01630 [Candidatus Sungbacteria bacterium RIFCSPLOWO2_02_FULL_47_9]|uniref:Uncharacterized protein n=1 Tax=Candidatus Sungbacteria bacterium RIFCSPHIGHO2_01_FULL_47_32 TaxID=1802264 RepID=A0A1G2K6M4_9BACT|nr:MAG: hypothetical protein UX72_C0022G0006 [Parcubacteria group bacterium GW2011_GWA2_47_10]OGZ94078.1 MAG: hypothetical protein A2633_03900 [Candidatus Sungbacteria bacterium RIFCSPHIGHO2_01_FULL_47_32]OGZ98514.1 MAG: hypothetical protein A3D57_00095 [Candidatus Sungbacteria bacterium RIFCSPHIGHO2_02_FULL_46_12]OHA05284.1 MAG: hypothetical protein A3A28_01705 [Candidatus Sungbacteria bacterium RIFCSPLOWO2_01_FULL_47_32]OHA11750.1 MAG: hypothetical protein A3H69_01630 [Candidatus Sungbacteria